MWSRKLFPSYSSPDWLRQVLVHRPALSGWTNIGLHLGLVLLAGVCVGLLVIVSTYYIENFKLVIGVIGGLIFLLLTMRWPEFGILSLVALLSGLIRLPWLPSLHAGPVTIHISDIMLLLLLGLLFLRVTTQPGFVIFSSPLMLPLLLFIGAFLLSAANAILVYHVNANFVLRTVRVLSLWIVFIPTFQLVRDERSLRRLLLGLLIFSFVLLIGVLFPNRFYPLLAVDETKLVTGMVTYSSFTRLYYAGDMILYAMVPVTVASLSTIKNGNQLWRIGLLALLLYWAFRTGYRQFWLTLLVVCVLLILFLSSQERIRLLKRVTPAIAASVLLVGMLMVTKPNQVERVVYVVGDRLGSLLHDPVRSENSLKWRAIENYYALIQISRHPILGLGLANNYRPPMESESDEDWYSEWTFKFIENGYLWIAVMMGLVGLLPFLWLCAAYLLRVLLHHHKIRDDSLRATYLGFGAAFLGMVACNLATPTFVVGTRLIFFPLSMAICEVILRLGCEKKFSNETFQRGLR